MWFPSSEPEMVRRGNLKKTHIPDLGYIRFIDKGNESILFISEEKIVGAWYLDIDTLEEYYETKAMKLMMIRPESKVEIYKMNDKLFNTILELNEECKLSLPVELDFIIDKYDANNPVDRDKLLLKYGIRDPSENDLDTLIKEYTK